MNKADIDRLISLEADRIRCCAERLIELYPPAPDDDHSLEEYIAKETTGANALDELGFAVNSAMRLLGIAKDYADLLNK